MYRMRKVARDRPGERPVLMNHIVSFNLTQRFRSSNSRSGPNVAPFRRDMLNEGRPEFITLSIPVVTVVTKVTDMDMKIRIFLSLHAQGKKTSGQIWIPKNIVKNAL